MASFTSALNWDRAQWRQALKRMEVQPPKSGTFRVDQWVNPDLAPMDKTRRTWDWWKYTVYWMTGGFAIYNYATGSALIAYGLSAKQCLTAGLVSPIVLALMCVLCGWPGGAHHITFTVTCRLAWGMRGSWVAVFFRVMPGLIWDGIEAFWGGQAVATMIGTWSLSWAEWDYPLADGTLQLKDFIGFVLYYVIFLLVMWLPPERLYKPFLVSCVMFAMVVTGILIWSVNTAGGGGRYFARDYAPPSLLAGSVGWAMVYGATSVLGNSAVITLGQSDWCRFSRDGNKVPMIAQAVACPIFIYLAFVLGIICTSAAADVLGDAYWQPYLLLRHIQSHYNNSPRSRAAVFFASAACAFAQVTVNIILNSVASAMDLACYSPKWLNIRRGAYLIAAVGVAVNPWKLTSSAATFIAVLSGFGTFYGPLSGILVADYWVVRRRTVKMRDLYLGNEQSIYWYWKGFNWRAFATFILAIFPAMPGYIMGCADLNRTPNGWMKLSRLGFITGFCIAMVVYPAFSWISPPPGLGEGMDHHDEDQLVLPQGIFQDRPTQGQFSTVVDADVIHGVDAVVDKSGSDDGSAAGAKAPITNEKVMMIP
ncbi:permease for cytosine/purines, uracil, thiamine, allantoin-domain-containing protein [Phyllosticta citricarpa]|uniref:Permease for cytosine/purines, uracil, thiamine, allantoin-domain-containing protein n=2 Tax=Phyllosticta TaxID=121621 RepID=A0ABR1MDS1_9PEZI